MGNQKQAIAGICYPLGAIGGHLVDKPYPCPANCFTEKHCSTLRMFRATIILCAQGHFVKLR
jgi:hypothetical protein